MVGNACCRGRSRGGCSGVVQQVDGGLLEYAGADAFLGVLAGTQFNDDRLDAGEVEDVREHETGWTGADDANLGSELLHWGS